MRGEMGGYNGREEKGRKVEWWVRWVRVGHANSAAHLAAGVC